jgi:hypothetical protein
MNPFLFILACSDYQLGKGDFTEEEKPRSETQDPSPDFPLVEACGNLGIYLPGLDSSGGESFYEICPLDTATDVYSSDDDGRVTQCTSVLESRGTNLTTQATSLFWDDIDATALLNCEIPLTVFTKFSREEDETSNEAVLTENTQTWVTFGYHKKTGNLASFTTEGLVDDSGNPTDRFPIDAIYLSGVHERPLSEFEDQDVDRDNARDVEMNVAVLPAKETVFGDNSLGFDFTHDGLSEVELGLCDNADANDGEKLVWTSDESADYSLSTLRTTIPGFVDPLTESLASFCGIDMDFRGTKYCATYFSSEEE